NAQLPRMATAPTCAAPTSPPAARPGRLCAAITTRLPRAFFDSLEHQPDAGFLVPKRSIQDQVERIRRVPISLVKLADAVRSALVFIPHPALGLGTADVLALPDLLDP